mgnify:FL=1
MKIGEIVETDEGLGIIIEVAEPPFTYRIFLNGETRSAFLDRKDNKIVLSYAIEIPPIFIGSLI